MGSVIYCFYVASQHPEIRCLTATYVVINGNISIQTPLHFVLTDNLDFSIKSLTDTSNLGVSVFF